MYKKREKINIILSAIKKDMQTLPMACRKAEIGLSTWYWWETKIKRLHKIRKETEKLCGEYRSAAMEDANFKSGLAGNVAAQCFFLKNKAGWKDDFVNFDQSQHYHFDLKQGDKLVAEAKRRGIPIPETLARRFGDTRKSE